MTADLRHLRALAPPWPYRVHDASGRTFPTWQPAAAIIHADALAARTRAPVAVERWDSTRQQWVLVDLVEPRP
jgi:hypothetical protein